MRTALIYNFLLEANIMASMAIVLMLAVRRLLRKQLGNRAICFAWLLVAIRLLCPLALPNPVIHEIRPASLETDAAIRPIAGQIKVRLSDAVGGSYMDALLANEFNQNEPAVKNLQSLLGSMNNGIMSLSLMRGYAIGCTAVLGWFLIANVRFRRKLRADRIEPLSGELLEQYQALCAERKVKPLPVYFVDPLPSACLVGVLRPHIALPLSTPPKDALQVLAHEICHYQGRDHWWNVARLCCCAVHWFNPLVWLAASLSRTDSELLCDDRVTRRMPPEEKKAYAGALVLAAAKRTAPGVSVLATGMTMTGRKLKSRVSGILSNTRPIKALAFSFVLLSSMLLVGAFATAELPQEMPEGTYHTFQLKGRETTIASLDGAIARAQEIAQLDTIQVEVEPDQWEARFYADDWMGVEGYQGTYWIRGIQPDGRMFNVSLLTDGSVWSIVNNLSWDDAAPPAEDADENSPWRKEIPQFLLDFAEKLTPGIASQMKLTFISETVKDGQRVLTYDAAITPATTFTFVVQVEPELRVLMYSPGNG